MCHAKSQERQRVRHRPLSPSQTLWPALSYSPCRDPVVHNALDRRDQPRLLARLSHRKTPPGFAGAFFFSVETLATVGYGDMHPQTLYGHVVAMIEIFVGLMSLALITGIMFARFSRPQARFLFTRNAVVRPIDGKRTLVFRAVNQRQNVVQDASALLRMLRDEVTEEGFRIRRVTDLPLLRSQHPLFILGWTIMHVIDHASPLWSETAESLEKSKAAFVLSLSGTDENTGQVLMARAEYSSADIRWNSTFLLTSNAKT